MFFKEFSERGLIAEVKAVGNLLQRVIRIPE